MREEEAVVAVIAIGCGTGLLYAVLQHLSTICKKWIEVSLKRVMATRGYTADEIIAVVRSERACDQGMSSVPPAKPIRRPAPTY
jgi:hypothetical protein